LSINWSALEAEFDWLRSLADGQSFIWNATNLNRQLRGMLIRLFANYQASIRIVYLETSWAELLRRNCDRIAKVPEKVLSRMKHRLDVPDITETQAVGWMVH